MNNPIYALMVCLFALYCCKKEEEKTSATEQAASQSINKIMALGASRIEGNRAENESFTYELWNDLKAAGWNVDFVDTHENFGSTLKVQDQNADSQNGGRFGWTSADILNALPKWLNASSTPDVVLFSSPGGNDIIDGVPLETAIQNINSIIDVLQANNPQVTILIEQLAPAHSGVMDEYMTQSIDQMHEEIARIARKKTTVNSKVIAVDMFTGFDNHLLADDMHYNQAGAEFIADRYTLALESVLLR